MTFAALTLAFGATACQATASSSPAPQKLVGAQSTTSAEAPATADPSTAAFGGPSSATAPAQAPKSSAAPTTLHSPSAAAHSSAVPTQHPTTRPAQMPTTTTRPAAPPPTTSAPAVYPSTASGCIPHTVGRCGAGEPHPPGTMALCNDGTYSYSTTPSGTCSHHTGVAVWYY